MLLGKEGTQAEAEKDSPAVGKIRVKDGTRVLPTPAGQGIFFGKTLVGYVEASSGRQLAISIMVRDVPVLGITEEQDELAVAIQQGY